MLRKEEILSRTANGLDVFKHYIASEWRVGRNFLNPLYADGKASCNIYYDRRTGTYRMKDFGNDDYSGDCFFLVGYLKGLDCQQATGFVEILQTIDRELGLGLETGVPTNVLPRKAILPVAPPTERMKETPSPFTLKEQPLREKEVAFWKQYGITAEVLKRYRVVSLQEYTSENKEGKPFRLSSSAAEPMFGYVGKQTVKIYRPGSQIRFLYGGHTGDNYCFGLEQLPAKGDLLFITGGEKDVMSLAAHGFHALCFNSETAAIPSTTIHRLTYRFKHILLLFDVDKTGLESSAKQEQALSSYGVRRLLLPLAGTKTEKDVSDYFREGHTREELMQLFLIYLNGMYSETMAALKSCEVDFTNPPPTAQQILSVNDVPLGTQGNLLCITGGEGTGKSSYVAALIAGAVCPPESEVDTLGISVAPNRKGKAVLFYDTEQSEQQLYKNIGNLLRRAGREEMPTYFKAYCLTGMSRKERLQAIIQSMDTFHYQYQGILLVVIDGIADLIRCANDEAESIAVVEELYRLAGIYKTCITTVLHFIPNGMKLRGHLGSELQRKAAAILSIEKDDSQEVSVVKALKVRDGSPLDVPMMQFVWDKRAGMHVYQGEKPREEKEKRKEKELTDVARDVFGRQTRISYIDLCEQIQELLDVKERTAKSYIRFMREKEIITKDPTEGSYYMKGVF